MGSASSSPNSSERKGTSLPSSSELVMPALAIWKPLPARDVQVMPCGEDRQRNGPVPVAEP